MTLDIPFGTIDWTEVPATVHHGEAGTATWRTVQTGSVRIRLVTYSPGYRADHWCSKGHIVHVLSGQFTTVHDDGASHALSAGMTYYVGDDVRPHRSHTEVGAQLLIVD
jgi:quercetin dioxygenase-like cupin family protein